MKRILIVDDDAAIRSLLAKYLSREHEAFTSEDGMAAVTFVQEHRNIEFAFIDMKMPGMDGLDTMRELKKTIPQLQVVIITGYAKDERIETALQEGAITCLSKPFHLEAVKQLLET